MKDFDNWNNSKKIIEEGKRAPVKKGEVYWCRVGLNIGVEMDGKDDQYLSPVLIIKKFSNEIVLCGPLTSKKHGGDWYYHLPTFGEKSYAILNQIKLIDTKRLLSSMGQLGDTELKSLINAYFKLISE